MVTSEAIRPFNFCGAPSAGLWGLDAVRWRRGVGLWGCGTGLWRRGAGSWGLGAGKQAYADTGNTGGAYDVDIAFLVVCKFYLARSRLARPNLRIHVLGLYGRGVALAGPADVSDDVG
jgi:hypothetical protein